MDIIAIIIASMSAIIALVSIIITLRLASKLKDLRADLSTDIADVHQENGSVRKKVDEVLYGSIGLKRKIDEIQKCIETLSENQEDLKLQDPNGRMYSRARKMISLGAGIDEVVRECEIPKSEAELLFSVQGKSLAGSELSQEPIEPKVKNIVREPPVPQKPITKSMENMNVREVDNGSNVALPKEAEGLMQHFNKMKAGNK